MFNLETGKLHFQRHFNNNEKIDQATMTATFEWNRLESLIILYPPPSIQNKLFLFLRQETQFSSFVKQTMEIS